MEQEQFLALLRSVKFEATRIYPEPEDSECDWSLEDKLDFYIQSFALNAIESKTAKTFTFEEFKVFFETIMKVELEATVVTYLLEDSILFAKQTRIDDEGNLYILLSTTI